MKFTIQDLQALIKESLQEKQWNKGSNTPRDYSKEYNPPGSDEQDERNKRKRDKRKHDKENGECPSGEELHHVNGIEKDEVECEPLAKNRGRKGEGARVTKDITIKIIETKLREVIRQETSIAIEEVFGSLAGAALSAMAKGAMGAVGAKAGEEALDMLTGDDEEDDDDDDEVKKKIKNLNLDTYDDLGAALDGVLAQATDKKLAGSSDRLQQHLNTLPGLIKHLK
jgi:hypothetical protein